MCDSILFGLRRLKQWFINFAKQKLRCLAKYKFIMWGGLDLKPPFFWVGVRERNYENIFSALDSKNLVSLYFLFTAEMLSWKWFFIMRGNYTAKFIFWYRATLKGDTAPSAGISWRIYLLGGTIFTFSKKNNKQKTKLW